MSAAQVIILLLIGLAAGMLGSMVGIGGGIIIVPCLVLIMGMSQLNAQGTSLAMLLPPIGILGVWQYYRQGHVDLKVAAVLCAGFVLGGFFGAKIVLSMDKALVKKIFATFLVILGLYFLFFEQYTKRPEKPVAGNPSDIRTSQSETNAAHED
jgi:hypothetical protein